MPYGKKRTPAKRKKHIDPSWRQPTSPSRRKEPWCTITVRRAAYAMMRELAEHHDTSIGEVLRELVEKEFHKTLWRVQQDTLIQKRGEKHDRA